MGILDYNDGSAAANPGKIVISLDKHIAYYYPELNFWRRWLLRNLLSGSDSHLESIADQQILVKFWLLTRRRFLRGCINPAKILDAKSGLVAAFTDLGNSGPQYPYPVIKIFNERLDLIRTRIPKNNLYIATVAMYTREQDSMANKHWADFSPQIPDCFTDNFADCQRALESIRTEAWECLREGLAQVPTPYAPGLYPVKLPNHLVNSAY